MYQFFFCSHNQSSEKKNSSPGNVCCAMELFFVLALIAKFLCSVSDENVATKKMFLALFLFRSVSIAKSTEFFFSMILHPWTFRGFAHVCVVNTLHVLVIYNTVLCEIGTKRVNNLAKKSSYGNGKGIDKKLLMPAAFLCSKS